MKNKVFSIRLIYLILILANICLVLTELLKLDTPKNISIAFSASAFINIIFSIIILFFIFITFAIFLQKWRETSNKRRKLEWLSFRISRELIFASIMAIPFLIISFKIAIDELLRINLFTQSIFWNILIFCVVIWIIALTLTISIYIAYKNAVKKIVTVEMDAFSYFTVDNFDLEITNFYSFALVNGVIEVKIIIIECEKLYLNNSFIKRQFIINESKRSSNPPRFLIFNFIK